MPVTVMLVDDHPVFMAGVRAILNQEKGINIVGEAKDGNEAVKLVQVKRPDIIVMDITMPSLNGIEATKQILKLSLGTKILALSIHSGRRFVKSMLDAGVAGYLLKDSAPEELVTAILKVAKGEMFLSSTITSIALSKDESHPESIKVLTTKLNRPSITSDHLFRAKIFEQLEENVIKPLTIVSAPVGYGKSITISQWLENNSKRSNWISLDEEHDNLTVFLRYIVAAIDQLFPGALKDFEGSLNNKKLPSIRPLIHSLVNELDQIRDKFIIVLDDYHNINNPEIHGFIEEFLRFPPKNLHLCIISQTDPPLSLSSLRMHNRMHELRSKELSFTKSEIIKLYKNSFKIELNEDATASLYEKTEGWVAGLRMISLIIDEPEEANLIEMKIDGNIHLVSEFLNSELLVKQKINFRDQLLKSSILDRFCVGVLDELFSFGNENEGEVLDGDEFIENLIRSSMFVIPLDNSRNWFRYHNQFRNLLLYELKKRNTKNEIKAYNNAVSEWFERNNLIDEAIKYAYIAENTEKIIQIIELHGKKMIDVGKWYIVNKWLSKLPDDVISNRPELLISKAWMHMYNFDVEALSPIMDRIDDLMKQGSGEHLFSGEVAYFRGHSSIKEFQDGAKGLEYLEQALKLISINKVAFRAETELLFGIAGQMQGQSTRVIKQVKHWLNESISLAPLRETRLLLVLKLISFIELKLEEAAIYFDRCRSISKLHGLEDSLSWCNYLEGLVLLQKGDLKGAIDLLEKVKNKRFFFHAKAAMDAMIALTIAYQMDGQSQSAKKTILVLEEFNQSLGAYFSDLVNSCKARLGILQGNGSLVNHWSVTNPCNPSMATLFWFEIICATRCRLLIADGSDRNLREAEKILTKFEEKNVESKNTLHLIDILALQAILYYKQEKFEMAFTALEKSLALAESCEFVFPFLESGALMMSLIKLLPKRIKQKSNIENILSRIKDAGMAIHQELDRKQGGGVPKHDSKSLTPRELAVLEYLSSGMRNKEIALALFVSDDTVKKHLYNMFQKLSVKNRLSLVSKARELGLI